MDLNQPEGSDKANDQDNGLLTKAPAFDDAQWQDE